MITIYQQKTFLFHFLRVAQTVRELLDRYIYWVGKVEELMFVVRRTDNKVHRYERKQMLESTSVYLGADSWAFQRQETIETLPPVISFRARALYTYRVIKNVKSPPMFKPAMLYRATHTTPTTSTSLTSIFFQPKRIVCWGAIIGPG